MKKLILWTLALMMMAAPMSSPAAQAEKVELYVLAAASLTDVMAQIADSYKEVAPEVEITFVFDSSGTLQSQIEAGATADVFVSAAQRQMDALEEGGLIKGKPQGSAAQSGGADPAGIKRPCSSNSSVGR